MALLLCESFEAGVFGADADFALNGFTVSGTLGTNILWDSTGGRFGDGAARIRSESPQPYLMKTFRQAVVGTVLRCAFGLTITAGAYESGSAPFILRFQNSTPNRYWELRIMPQVAAFKGGQLFISRFDDITGATVGVIQDGFINDGKPHHVELELVAHTSTGALKMFIDGVAQSGNIASGDTSDAASGDVTSLDRVYFGSGRRANVAQYAWFDDFVVWDDDGADFTGQLGPHRISVQTVDGAGDVTQFTPSAGSNYQNVDEVSPDSDTTYNEDATPTDADLYTVTSMTLNPTTIMGVNIKSFVKNPDAGAKTFEQRVRENVTSVNGTATFTAQAAYTTQEDFFPVDPDTSVAWTQTNINAMQIGLEVIS